MAHLQPNSRWLKIGALALLALAIILRGWLLFIRRFDPDEFQYLRGALCVFRGWLPYKDFFEHHTPLFFYLLAPLFALGENPDLIFIARMLMFSFAILNLLLVFRLGRAVYGPAIAWIASVWLSFIVIYFNKTLEIRPLLPALLFFLSGMILAIDPGGRASNRRAFFAGIFFSLSFLCTQKIIFLLIGVGLAGIVQLRRRERGLYHHQIDLRRIALLCTGFLMPLLLFLLYFWVNGGAKDFIYRNIVMNLAWKRREPLEAYPIGIAYANPFFFFWGIWGWAATGLGIFTGKETKTSSFIWFPASAAVVGLFATPVVFGQYYALILPLFAILAAKGFLDFLSRLQDVPGRKRLAGCLLILLSGPGLLVLTGFVPVRDPARLAATPRLLNPLFIGGVAIISLLLAAEKRQSAIKRSLALLVLLLLSRPTALIFRTHRDNNSEQMRIIKTIMRRTHPEDRVLDGWEPYGSLLRLPAYYYHFLHEGVLLMMSPEEKGEALLLALQETRPKIIIRGEHLLALSPGVRDYISSHYRGDEGESSFLIRER